MQNLKERIVKIQEGDEFTDERFFQKCSNLIDEYSEKFPKEGRQRSLEAVIKFMFIFVNDNKFVSPFNVNALTQFCHQLISVYSDNHEWEEAEELAYKLLKYKALKTTYGEGREGLIAAYNSWVNIIRIISEDDIVPKEALIKHLFMRLITMYDHDVLYMPACHFWKISVERFGVAELSPELVKKQLDYFEFVEETRAYNPE